MIFCEIWVGQFDVERNPPNYVSSCSHLPTGPNGETNPSFAWFNSPETFLVQY